MQLAFTNFMLSQILLTILITICIRMSIFYAFLLNKFIFQWFYNILCLFFFTWIVLEHSKWSREATGHFLNTNHYGWYWHVFWTWPLWLILTGLQQQMVMVFENERRCLLYLLYTGIWLCWVIWWFTDILLRYSAHIN
jgi:hypothetical protein